MKLVIATTNKHKLAEYRRLLPRHKLITLKKPPAVNENGKTLRANAVLKAKAHAKLTPLPVLADDTGLFVEYLQGRPGLRSARWTNGDFGKARANILRSLTGVAKARRTARFECVIAWYEPKTKNLKTFAGKCDGLISQSEQGSAGFGYDSIFFEAKLGQTFGQVRPEQKDRVSHRARALRKLKNYLKMRLSLWFILTMLNWPGF